MCDGRPLRVDLKRVAEKTIHAARAEAFCLCRCSELEIMGQRRDEAGLGDSELREGYPQDSRRWGRREMFNRLTFHPELKSGGVGGGPVCRRSACVLAT